MPLSKASARSIVIAIAIVVAIGIGGAVASPVNTVQFLGFCSVICASLLTMLNQIQQVARTKMAIEKVEQLTHSYHTSHAQTVSSIDDLKELALSTNKLVNGNMAAQMRISALALRRIADMTNDPKDIRAAEIAEDISSKLRHDNGA